MKLFQVGMLLMIFCSQMECIAYGKVTGAYLSNEIAKAKILPGGQPVSASVTGGIATLSTYTSSGANANHECRLNAVNLAKNVFALDSSLSGVIVQFHEPTNTALFRQ